MIFRKVALERLSSPEQLDQMMQVTDPRGWLALAALAALLAAALVWGFLGTIPTEASGQGILIRRGGVSDLVATSNGQVEEMLVAVGDRVGKGQVVAKVRQQGLQRQVNDALAKLAELRREYDEIARSSAEQKQLNARELAQQRANLGKSIEALGRDIALTRERLATEQKLADEGLVTKQTPLATEQHLNTARDQLASAQLELNGLDLKRLQAERQLDVELETRRSAIRDLERETRENRAKLAEDVGVLAPFSGRVLELMVARGDVVSPGTAILSLELTSEELLAVLFVPPSEGKRVHAGMKAQVSPSTVKREEYGSMLGTVTWAAEFPSTARGMTRLLANEALVTSLMKEGPPLQINVVLQRDPSTPTGYRWSSSRGPQTQISSGTLASGSVIVREDRPISLLVPKMREQLGI